MAVDFRAGIVAIAILFAIYQYLKRTAGPARWADSRRSYHLQLSREHLLAAANEPEHPRYWRPQILAMSENPEGRSQLLEFASWVEGGSGLTTAVRVIEGEGAKMRKVKADAEAELQQDLQKKGAPAFPLVISAPEIQMGIQTLVQAYGIGTLKANTMLLNWLGTSHKQLVGLEDQKYGKNLRSALLYGCNIIFLDVKADKWKAIEETSERSRFIDVWWWGDATSRLMLLMAYLMTRHENWDQSKIRLLAVDDGSKTDLSIDSIRGMLEEVRIKADAEIVRDVDDDTFAEYSADAALAFIPFRIKKNEIIDPFGNPMQKTLFLLPVTAIVLAAEDIELGAEPEEGKAGEMAEAIDAWTDAEKRVRDLEKEATQSSKNVARLLEKLQQIKASAQNPNSDTAELRKLEQSAEEAEQQAQKAIRRLAKAKAKLETATKAVEALGIVNDKAESTNTRNTES